MGRKKKAEQAVERPESGIPGLGLRVEAGGAGGPTVKEAEQAGRLRDGTRDAGATTHPTLVEYRVGGEEWRVERFDLLRAEFVVEPKELPDFHALVVSAPKAWLIVRRLYGIQPVLLPMNATEDFGLLSAAALCELLVLDKEQLRQQLDAVKGLWRVKHLPAAETSVIQPDTNLQGQLVDEDQVLREAGFSESMFQIEGRAQEDTQAERGWFIAQVRRWRKMLDNPMSGELARLTLQDILFLRRCEQAILRTMPGTDKYGILKSEKELIARKYQERLEALNELNPWMEAVTQAEAARGMIGDFIRGVQEYQSQGSNQLLMGLATALEMEIESSRRCVQVPDPQMRGSLILLVQEARANLWDQKWKFSVPDKIIRRFDKAFTAGLNAALDEDGEPRIDLMSDDPVTGEYPAIESFAPGQKGAA